MSIALSQRLTELERQIAEQQALIAALLERVQQLEDRRPPGRQPTTKQQHG